ncbi:MAG: hypothetical protein KUG80_07805 [Gammaproteobacteria bacterium]|nr:hypothetical protein [Gammaproteobacteria bacterium]
MDNTQYFCRTGIFTRNNGQVALTNIHRPEQSTALDDWLGIVVSLADGQHTIEMLFDYLAGQYPQAPDNLKKTLYSVVERLVEGKIIRLSKEAVSLPYYLSAPLEELDVAKAKKLIEEDGYIQSNT